MKSWKQNYIPASIWNFQTEIYMDTSKSSFKIW